jgi:hypothetical protein
MKIFKFVILMTVALLASTTVGRADEPLRVKFASGVILGIPSVKITALDDLVIIREIKYNRGNCRIIANNLLFIQAARFPREIRFGQTIELMGACNQIIEVTITTNKGDYTFRQ